MTNEEQVLAAIEEIANQLNDLRKVINRPASNAEVDLSPISVKLDSMEEQLQKFSYANNSRNSESNKISESLINLQDILSMKQNEIVHRYIEVKQPHNWIIGTIVFFVLNISVCFFVVNRNQILKDTIETIQPNDFKYRYIKLKSYNLNELRKDISNTYDLTTSVDSFYKENQQEINDYVIKREEQIRQAIEASEIAKNKEAEAKVAKEEAMKLKSVIE